MERYRLRFHLGRGDHFMHWQIRHGENTHFFNPDGFKAVLHNAKLCNQRSTADRIYAGENKTVCSWIEFDKIELVREAETKRMPRLYYNPRHLPHWTWWVNQGIVDKENLDGTQYDTVIVNGTSIYIN